LLCDISGKDVEVSPGLYLCRWSAAELVGSRHAVVLAATQHQVAKRVTNVRVLILVGRISEPFLTCADGHPLKVVAAAQGFSQQLALAVDDQA